jgi:diguanylate cyclase (GGDEF)-like protein/PAS domain S-box-containing protein
MLNNVTKRISLRLAGLLTIVAIIVVSLNTIIIFNRSYQAELDQSRHNLTQLMNAIINTAAISAYIEDVPLATEVVAGLKENDLVNAVELKTNEKLLATHGDFLMNEQQRIHYPLNSPFDDTEVLGELIVQPNDSLIKAYAYDQAMEYVVLMAINSAILIIFVIVLVNYRFISGVKKIASGLHQINIGSKQRIYAGGIHKDDEVGMLVSDINRLLSSVESTLSRERGLRMEVESLEQRFRSIFEQASGGIALIDTHGFLKVHNPYFERILGKERMSKLLGENPVSLSSVMDSEQKYFYNSIGKVCNDDTSVSIDIRLDDAEEIRWLHCLISKVEDKQEGVLLEVLVHDISERRTREQTFQSQAELDPLTSLYNRRAGREKIQQLLTESMDHPQQYALLMLDLDNFKPINDTYGHDAGDQVLVGLAKRLAKTIRSDDIIVRWGGDEFLIFIKQGNLQDEASQVAIKLLNTVQEPILIDDEISVEVGVSIGIAIFPDQGFDFDVLLQRADKAMYKIKSEIKGSFVFYDDWKFNTEE